MENNQFVSDGELATYINNSLAELDDILVTNYEDYRLSNFASVLTGSTHIIPIPADFYKLRGVDYQIQAGTGQWYSLQGFQFPERNRNNNSVAYIAWPYGRNRLSYRLADQGIIIMPQDQATGNYQIWYTPMFNPLTDPSDLLPISYSSQAWVEYAVVDCCIKIFNKQNLDPSGFLAEKQALRARVIGASKNRNAAGPKRIANTRFQSDDSLLYGFGENYPDG